MRNSIKQYAKEAKRRLKGGFWEEYRDKIRTIKDVAEQEGKNPDTQLIHLRQLTTKRIYEYDKFVDDEEFYEKTKAILESEEVVKNPIKMLADEKILAKLDHRQMEAYLLGISRRFEQMRIRYEKEMNM